MVVKCLYFGNINLKFTRKISRKAFHFDSIHIFNQHPSQFFDCRRFSKKFNRNFGFNFLVHSNLEKVYVRKFSSQRITLRIMNQSIVFFFFSDFQFDYRAFSGIVKSFFEIQIVDPKISGFYFVSINYCRNKPLFAKGIQIFSRFFPNLRF